MDFGFSVFGTPGAWVSLLTLTFLEIVLGIDNVIFISIAANALPKKEQPLARNLGLIIALFFRVGLLIGISYIIKMTTPIITLFGTSLSGRDLILIGGGLFLMAKSTTEIHHKIAGDEKEGRTTKVKSAFFKVVVQIIFFDIIFSFDSILTAVGLTPYVMIMILAIVISMLVMMKFSGVISNIIEKFPTLQILALSFLIMIGLTLILEGFGVHVNKAFIYVAVIFSLAVEGMNIRFMGNKRR
ncbi:MAG: Integral rane protein TerC [Bacteroidota bacterium]|nr:Integral rane protein TerC [Bacteroidota bacterium]